MYPFWPLSGALQLPKWCMLITEMAHPIYRISGALTLPKSGALSVTDYISLSKDLFQGFLWKISN